MLALLTPAWSRLRSLAAARRSAASTLASLLPAAYALVIGLTELQRVRSRQLAPDAITYLRLARQMTWANVLDGPKEPLWSALLAVPVKLVGAHPTVIRLLGVAGFVLLIVAFQRLVTLLYGRAWGIVAALLFGASPWLIYQSARGLREEASTGLVLLFAAAARKGVAGRRLPMLAAAAAVIALLRWDSVLLTVPTLVIAAIISRPRPRRMLLSGSIFVAIVAPLLVMQKLRYGDPLFFSSTRAPMFFRNLEFQGRPGFPTAEEVRRNAYTGEPISWFDYFFHLHTPQETAYRALTGSAELPLTVANCTLAVSRCRPAAPHWPTLALLLEPPALLAWLIMAAGLVGSVLLIRRRGTWMLPLMLAMSILTFAPIARMADPRLFIPTLPFLLVGAIECVHAWRRRAGNPPEQESPAVETAQRLVARDPVLSRS